MVYTTTQINYSATKIFGIDCVKTAVYSNKQKALEEIEEMIRVFREDYDDPVAIIENENEETLYIIHQSEDPKEYVAVILRRCEIK